MLTKTEAKRVSEALKVGQSASRRLYNTIVSAKTGKLSASVHTLGRKEVKALKMLANNICKKLSSSINTRNDLLRAMDIGIVEKLMAQASGLRMTAEVLDNVIEDCNEFSELPDDDVEGTAKARKKVRATDGAEAEPDETGTPAELTEDPITEIEAKRAMKAQKKVRASGVEDIVDDIDAEDELDDIEDIDAEDEIEDLDAEDELDEIDDVTDVEEVEAGLDDEDEIGTGGSDEIADEIVEKVAKARRIARAKGTTRRQVNASNNYGFSWNFGQSGR